MALYCLPVPLRGAGKHRVDGHERACCFADRLCRLQGLHQASVNVEVSFITVGARSGTTGPAHIIVQFHPVSMQAAAAFRQQGMCSGHGGRMCFITAKPAAYCSAQTGCRAALRQLTPCRIRGVAMNSLGRQVRDRIVIAPRWSLHHLDVISS